MAKQLFNSSESSNFILNLTEEKYAKLASIGMITAFIASSLATAVPIVTKNYGYYVLSAAGLATGGVICMIVAIIALMKKYITKSQLFPVCAFAAMTLWGVAALLNSYDINIGFYGYAGRGEGLLSTFFYLSFFVAAASIRRSKAVNSVFYGLTAAGLLNSAVGLVQVFTGEFSHYRMISFDIQANAASGLAQSPLFLAMLLTMSLIASLIAFVSFESRGKKIFFLISACIFSFTMMFTYSLIGVCGAALAVVITIVYVLASKAKKVNIASVLAVIAPAAAAVLLVNAGAIGLLEKYELHDGDILWFADSYFRLSASGAPDSNKVDLSDTYDVYYTLNRKTMNIISAHPLTGTGQDQLVFPQLYTTGIYTEEDNPDISDIISENTGTFDRVYNEYLNTAATRGVPAAVCLVAVILSVLFISGKRFKKGSAPEKAMFLLTLSGALIYLIGCSNTVFAPVFWCIAGCAIAQIKDEPEKVVVKAEETAAEAAEKE
ncbi:MAG: O-antigen ligase family protein [Ruminococcus sp.]|nr:O-antigen ligase family protein [Ruminococcus sp.]